jgi:cytochrome c554/c'-like protein
MKRLLCLGGLVVFAGAALSVRLAVSEEKGGAPAKFVGVANCKLCHSDDATGNQFEQWKKGPHAGALKALATPQAKELAAKKGVTDPTKDIKCLKCHLTGAEAPKSQKARTFKDSDAVGCESCHGAGEHYAKDEVFKKGKDAAIALGLVEPDEKVCVKCHNPESPSYKPFDFKTFFEKVKHPNPKKPKK